MAWEHPWEPGGSAAGQGQLWERGWGRAELLGAELWGGGPGGGPGLAAGADVARHRAVLAAPPPSEQFLNGC